LERQAFKLKGNEMKEIAKQQEEMFFIATDWDKNSGGRPDEYYQGVGSSVNEAVENHREIDDGAYPKYVYVVSKQLVAQAPNYI
jgi:hypothetical protein